MRAGTPSGTTDGGVVSRAAVAPGAGPDRQAVLVGLPSAAPGPSGRDRGPRLLSCGEALGSGDPTHVLMAQALVWLMRFAPASLGLFSTVDQRLAKFGQGTVVAHGPRVAVDGLEQRLVRYSERYHLVDPFAPRRCVASAVSVVDLSGLGAEHPRELSQYVSEFLGGLGMCAQTSLYLRANGRIAAAVDLMRTSRDPAITGPQLGFLRGSHPFLEQAYACALGLPSAPTSSEVIARAALTRREAEVARLVAQGASNAETGLALGISETTVKSHLLRVFEKLSIRSRTQLAVLFTSEYTPGPAGLAPVVDVGSVDG
jgi:DNA-binding CsgD family transcriptional regulator